MDSPPSRPAAAPPPPPDGDRVRRAVSQFDAAARHYDTVAASLGLGSGRWYRRFALRRAGLRPGMRLLDVAAGTGLVAQAGIEILGDPRAVIAVDASLPMLRQARPALAGHLVQAWAEALPFRDDGFDMLTLGFVVRHVPDLDRLLRECRRVLRPGGRLLLLELSRPESRALRWLASAHLRRVLPGIVAWRTASAPARQLAQDCWGTIEESVPPAAILDALGRQGFAEVRRHVWFGVFAEYFAGKPSETLPHRASRAIMGT